MSNPIDIKVISKLAEILDKTNLSELAYEDEGLKIKLSRQGGVPVPPVFTPAPAPIATPSAAPVAVSAHAEESGASADADYANNPNAVKSPMVGVVYLTSNPNTPNYVNVGDTVAQGDTVCLIEAMKTFNPVKAHKGGRVSKILVEAGDPVEYGEPLIVIE